MISSRFFLSVTPSFQICPSINLSGKFSTLSTPDRRDQFFHQRLPASFPKSIELRSTVIMLTIFITAIDVNSNFCMKQYTSTPKRFIPGVFQAVPTGMPSAVRVWLSRWGARSPLSDTRVAGMPSQPARMPRDSMRASAAVRRK